MDDTLKALAAPTTSGPNIVAPRALRVLVVDDERNDRETLSAALKLLGCRVDMAENREGALGRARGEPYDLAFLDLMLGTESGVDLVPALRSEEHTSELQSQ